MSDPVCCILAVCCPGGSDRQREALAEALDAAYREDPNGVDRTTARQHADWILDHFDLAPKGTLDPLKQEVARLAKGNARG